MEPPNTVATTQPRTLFAKSSHRLNLRTSAISSPFFCFACSTKVVSNYHARCPLYFTYLSLMKLFTSSIWSWFRPTSRIGTLWWSRTNFSATLHLSKAPLSASKTRHRYFPTRQAPSQLQMYGSLTKIPTLRIRFTNILRLCIAKITISQLPAHLVMTELLCLSWAMYYQQCKPCPPSSN